VALGQFFFLLLRFPLLILITPNAPYSSIIWDRYSRPNSDGRTKWTQSHPTPRNLKKTTNFTGWGGLRCEPHCFHSSEISTSVKEYTSTKLFRQMSRRISPMDQPPPSTLVSSCYTSPSTVLPCIPSSR
jgi:hypothetical protein